MVNINIFSPVADKNTILLIPVYKNRTNIQNNDCLFFLFTLYKNINSSGEFSILVHALYELLSIILIYILLIYVYKIVSIIGPQSISVHSLVLCKKKKQLLLSKYSFNGFTSYINTCLDRTHER